MLHYFCFLVIIIEMTVVCLLMALYLVVNI